MLQLLTNLYIKFTGKMKVFSLFTLLLLYGAAAAEAYQAGGTSYFIPDYNLLGDDMVGGYHVFKDLPQDCIIHTEFPVLDSVEKHVKNTEAFYSNLATLASISGELTTDFTMGTTLDATTQLTSGSERTVSGFTFVLHSRASEDVLQASCMAGELDDTLAQTFESLPQKIDMPWLTSSWPEYESFLKTYGSHVVRNVHYGCSLYQHTYATASKEYTQREFEIKACGDIAGPTGNLDVSVCSGVTAEDIASVSSMESSSRFVARGGTDETRAQLYAERTDELITKFLSETETTQQPILYKYAPIWVILKSKYLGTEHFAKALNLEAFYKGYLNYGCQYRETGNTVLQNFTHSPQSTDAHPIYQCVIPSEGCQDDNDCHQRAPNWCECRGDSCVRHYQEVLGTGDVKTVAEVHQNTGWAGPGCEVDWFTCYCVDAGFTWEVVWEDQQDMLMLTEILHSSALKKQREQQGKNKFEL